MDGHDQDTINFGQDVLDAFEGRFRVNGDARPDVERFNLADGVADVWARFDVDVDHGGARISNHFQITFRLFDHQVNVEREFGYPADCGNDHRAKRDVRYEVTI